MKIFYVLIIFNFFYSCSRSQLKNIEYSMRKTHFPDKFYDSFPKENLISDLKIHLEQSQQYLSTRKKMYFSNREISSEIYLSKISELIKHVEKDQDWREWCKENFDFYEVYGDKKWSEVLVTGYYAPIVQGSTFPHGNFTRPLYKNPDNLYKIDFDKFDLSKNENSKITNRVRIEGKKVLPFYDRFEIDEGQKLANQNLELFWVDPIDAFFIQIQGSATVILENGSKFNIGYADQNGYKYEPIGKFLKDVIPKKEMSMQKIKNYLKTLSMNERNKIFNLNPSYVFFKILEKDFLTSMGNQTIPNRTIATDSHFFPKGALAFLDVKVPDEFGNWVDRPRIVFDQDTGGAIKGGGHIDLFFGSDQYAELSAGQMKEIGQLYYLLPK